MKGYPTNYGYMGLINGKYHLFATESEYEEAYWDNEKAKEEEK